MNDLAKNLLLWVVIAVVLMAVFQGFSPRAAGGQPMSYDSFSLRSGMVRSPK